MISDLSFFALAIPAVVMTGISRGGFGSGAAFVATPILALVLPPVMAVGIMLPLLGRCLGAGAPGDPGARLFHDNIHSAHHDRNETDF